MLNGAVEVITRKTGEFCLAPSAGILPAFLCTWTSHLDGSIPEEDDASEILGRDGVHRTVTFYGLQYLHARRYEIPRSCL